MQPFPYKGRILRSLQSDRLSASEFQYASGIKSSWHSHELAHCFFVLEGTYTQHIERGTRTISRCGLGVIPPGQPHKDVTPAGGGTLVLEFSADWTREYSRVLERPLELPGGASAGLAKRFHRELRAPDDMSALAIEGLALELVAVLSRASIPRKGPGPRWLARVVDLINSRFQESLTLDELAREAGVIPTHLVAVFRRHQRCTPFEYLRQQRIAFACRQLVSTRMSLAEIANDAGFADQSHLCRAFKSAAGMTPKAYRELFSRRP